MACKNAARFVGEALATVATQTHPHSEILVVDDGSTDGSIDAIRASGVAVRTIQTNFGNAAAARNVALREACSEWVAILDADDLWLPRHLEQAAALLKATEDVAYIANFFVQTDKGETIANHLNAESGISGLSQNRFFEMQLGFCHSAVLYRLQRVREVGGFDEKLIRRHDFDLWLRVVNRQTWAYSSVPTAKYRVDIPESISKKIAERNYYELQCLLKNLPSYDNCPEIRTWIRSAARRTVRTALTQGSPTDRRNARSLAWSWLLLRDRLLYRVLFLFPFLARMAFWLRTFLWAKRLAI